MSLGKFLFGSVCIGAIIAAPGKHDALRPIAARNAAALAGAVALGAGAVASAAGIVGAGSIAVIARAVAARAGSVALGAGLGALFSNR
jgi:hypothetical protein